MPFMDVAGKVGTVPPAHIICDVPKLKVGVTIWLTVTAKVTVATHSSGVAAGVKV